MIYIKRMKKTVTQNTKFNLKSHLQIKDYHMF